MSRRDALFKATAKALSPDALDLTQFRQRDIREPEVRAGRDTIVGGMGFSALDWKESPDDVELHPGDPMTAALLRLKVMPNDRAAFDRAHGLLLSRYVLADRRRREPSDTMYAIATAALFEWLFADCTVCRGKRPRPTVQACGTCKGGVLTTGGVADAAAAIESGALPGEVWAPRHFKCGRCDGYGRKFRKPKDSRGMKCAACGNTGKRKYEMRERARMVNSLLRDLVRRQRAWRRRMLDAAGVCPSLREVQELTFDVFSKRWMSKYQWFLNLLHGLDKKLTQSIDIQVTRAQNSAIVRELEEKDMLEDESDGSREDHPAA